MTSRALTERLRDILDAIRGIELAIGGLSYETYLEVRHLRRAVEREIEIISEASRHISDDLKARFPEIPWEDIAAIGNILRHGYADVDDDIIWSVTQKDLAPLDKVVRAMLLEIEKSDG
jgi:uncharacterized protein with HEPN domain